MKKAITFILVLAVLAGGFYFCMQAGFIDKWFPGVLEKVIPGYTPPNSAEGYLRRRKTQCMWIRSV